MKLANILSPLLDLRFALSTALYPTLKSILFNPWLLLRPFELSRVFMGHLWVVFGDGVDGAGKEVKDGLVRPFSKGVVLDVGAGHGHTVLYLDRALVTRYIALEPNVHMHEALKRNANRAGFKEEDGSLIVIGCGAEDVDGILRCLEGVDGQRGVGQGTWMQGVQSQQVHARHTSQQSTTGPPIDTLISILTLCTVPSPQHTLSSLVHHLLKPGGQLLYYEHTLHPTRGDVAYWQRFWAPTWACFFDGCRMDRESDVWVRELEDDEGESIWREGRVWGKPGEEEENLFRHSVGRYVKK